MDSTQRSPGSDQGLSSRKSPSASKRDLYPPAGNLATPAHSARSIRASSLGGSMAQTSEIVFCRSQQEVNSALRELCTAVLDTHLTSWFGLLTPNRDVQLQVTLAVAHLCRGIEARAHRVNWASLLLVDIPELLQEHYQAYGRSKNPSLAALHSVDRKDRVDILVRGPSNSSEPPSLPISPTSSIYAGAGANSESGAPDKPLRGKSSDSLLAHSDKGADRPTTPTVLSSNSKLRSGSSTSSNFEAIGVSRSTSPSVPRLVSTPPSLNTSPTNAQSSNRLVPLPGQSAGPPRQVPTLIAQQAPRAVANSFLPPLHVGVGDGARLTAQELAYHAQCPHVALSGADPETGRLPNLEEYVRQVAEYLLKTLGASTTVNAPTEFTLIREILVMVLGGVLEEWTSPAHLFQWIEEALAPYGHENQSPPGYSSQGASCTDRKPEQLPWWKRTVITVRRTWRYTRLVMETAAAVWHVHAVPWLASWSSEMKRRIADGSLLETLTGSNSASRSQAHNRSHSYRGGPGDRNFSNSSSLRRRNMRRRARLRAGRWSNLDVPLFRAINEASALSESHTTRWIASCWEQLVRPTLRFCAGPFIDRHMEVLAYHAIKPSRIAELIRLVSQEVRSPSPVPHNRNNNADKAAVLKELQRRAIQAIMHSLWYQYEPLRRSLEEHTLDALLSTYLNKHLAIRMLDMVMAHVFAPDLRGSTATAPASAGQSEDSFPSLTLSLSSSSLPGASERIYSSSYSGRTTLNAGADATAITRKRHDAAPTSLSTTLVKGVTSGSIRTSGRESPLVGINSAGGWSSATSPVISRTTSRREFQKDRPSAHMKSRSFGGARELGIAGSNNLSASTSSKGVGGRAAGSRSLSVCHSRPQVLDLATTSLNSRITQDSDLRLPPQPGRSSCGTGSSGLTSLSSLMPKLSGAIASSSDPLMTDSSGVGMQKQPKDP